VINLDANTVVRLQLWDIAGAFLAVHSTALLPNFWCRGSLSGAPSTSLYMCDRFMYQSAQIMVLGNGYFA
jgi:hypothetical protein